MEDQQCFAERVMQPAKFDELNPENVEEEIKKMGLFEDDYMSDDDTKVRIFVCFFESSTQTHVIYSARNLIYY